MFQNRSNMEKKIMKENKRLFAITLLLSSAVCLLPIALGFFLWGKLPENIPQQYGWNNQVNWTLPKPWGFILCPAFLVIINAIVQISTRLSKKELNKKVEVIVFWIIPVLSILVNSLIILKAAGLNIEISQSVILIISIVFIIIGNYMPKVEENAFIGIRAPWINKNGEVWTKTNRLGGILFVLTGIINLITCFTPAGKYVFIASVLIVSVVTFVYSLYAAKKYS